MGVFVEEMGRYVDKCERKDGGDGDVEAGHVEAAGCGRRGVGGGQAA